MALSRWFVSFVLAAGITVGLFYFMQYLIDAGERLSDPVGVVRVVDATMPEIELEVIEIIDRPEPIDQVIEPQTDPPRRTDSIDPVTPLGIVGETVDPNDGVTLTPAIVDFGSGELVPLIAIRPQYPPRALQRGIEGWCVVSFTVDGLGNVVEDSIVVVEAQPPGIFDRASIRAAARFKYQPRIVDGQGVEVPNRRYLFSFNLDD